MLLLFGAKPSRQNLSDVARTTSLVVIAAHQKQGLLFSFHRSLLLIGESPWREKSICVYLCRTVRIWDYTQDACINVLSGHKAPVRGLMWNTEVPFLLISGNSSPIHLPLFGHWHSGSEGTRVFLNSSVITCSLPPSWQCFFSFSHSVTLRAQHAGRFVKPGCNILPQTGFVSSYLLLRSKRSMTAKELLQRILSMQKMYNLDNIVSRII